MCMCMYPDLLYKVYGIMSSSHLDMIGHDLLDDICMMLCLTYCPLPCLLMLKCDGSSE